jgi:hypothetical protein
MVSERLHLGCVCGLHRERRLPAAHGVRSERTVQWVFFLDLPWREEKNANWAMIATSSQSTSTSASQTMRDGPARRHVLLSEDREDNQQSTSKRKPPAATDVTAGGLSRERRGGDSNPRCPCEHTAFPVLHNRPLCHLSKWFTDMDLASTSPLVWRVADSPLTPGCGND